MFLTLLFVDQAVWIWAVFCYLLLKDTVFCLKLFFGRKEITAQWKKGGRYVFSDLWCSHDWLLDWAQHNGTECIQSLREYSKSRVLLRVPLLNSCPLSIFAFSKIKIDSIFDFVLALFERSSSQIVGPGNYVPQGGWAPLQQNRPAVCLWLWIKTTTTRCFFWHFHWLNCSSCCLISSILSRVCWRSTCTAVSFRSSNGLFRGINYG